MELSRRREEWRDYLRDGDFWLNGYREPNAYIVYSSSDLAASHVSWIVGVGPMASFTRALSGIYSERFKRIYGPFEHMIKVDLKPTPTAEEAQGRGIRSIKYQVILAAAKELGLLDQEYYRLKEKHDHRQYYTYGCDGAAAELECRMRDHIGPLVGKQLSAKKYLLVVDNLQWPIELGSLSWDYRILPPKWTNSIWLIAPTSHDVYKKSKSEDDGLISIPYYDHVVFLTIYAVHQSAEYIRLNTIHQESIEYWHDIAIDCFHYAMAIFAEYSQGVGITADELIHQWATLMPCMTIKEEANTISSNISKCSDMRQVGSVILEAFQKYSLLQLPFSPANGDHEATSTGAQFLAYHGLIAESITIDELTENKKEWISFVGDHVCHVSREWMLSQQEETRGTSALVLRGCSQQSLILYKLNHFLSKLCFLRLLDLSYTPLKSLPSSISTLWNLRLLSLRGCYGLKTLTTSAIDATKNTISPLSTLFKLEILDLNGVPLSHLTQDVANRKGNLIQLDISHSEITTFPSYFFQEMLCLEELVLVNCSNLVELPPSMAALSSLTTIEITGTQIRFFPLKIFEEMHKLKSLKLIDNNNLVSLSRPISRVHEIKLEGHPTLISFSLIGAPHIQRLSLCGCRKLKSIELKNLGALEEIDFSDTSIDELPADIPNGPRLRRLLLLGVPSLFRFPWHMIKRLPEFFYLDQCTKGNGNHSDHVSQLCISDPRFFHSFGKSCVGSVRDGHFFQSFYVRVAPCSTNSRRLQHEEGMVDNKLHELLQKQSTYIDVYSSCYVGKVAIVPPITVPFRRTERHVEITGMQQPPDGLYSLLNVMKSISVTCDNSIEVFSDWSKFHDIEECELRWCNKMEQVFDYYSSVKNLRNMHVFNLKNLVRVCSNLCHLPFSSLEHLHLEFCPSLQYIMSEAVGLPCLKTMDILFCYNLKKIFCRPKIPFDICDLLPNLQRVRLQELPLLQHFQDHDATITTPMWKELHIRGCWSLQCLPRLQDQTENVKVNGERSWWNKLQWDSLSHRDSYEPKLPPKFASFDECAEVTSYLR